MGDVTGLKLRNIGAFPDGEFGDPAVPRSNSSQQYVNTSPFASVADPVNANGVLIGIVNPPVGTVTTGALFPFDVVTGHVFPDPDTVYAIISSILLT